MDPARVLAGELDVVHVHRYRDDAVMAAITPLRRRGVAIVWDNDDDMLAVPKQNPKYKNYSGTRRRKVIADLTRMVRFADAVTTPSPRLAEQYRELGAGDVRVIENYLPHAFTQERPRKHGGVVIGWVAGLEHQLDYEQLALRETMQRLLDSHHDLRFCSVGLNLGLPADRYEHVGLCEFQHLARANAGFDVGIAPLADIPFNQARSNVKLKEYAAAGTPWLASPVGPYATLGEDEGGRLVRDGDWHVELERLILGGRDRRKLAKRAARWGGRQTIERHVGEWEAVYRDAIAAANARRRAA